MLINKLRLSKSYPYFSNMKKLKLDELNRIDIKTFKEVEKTPIMFVLDNVRSAHNVGAAFRTSDAFACKKLVLCGITAQPPHRDIHKTAIGATASVDWIYYKDTKSAIKALKEEGYKVYAIEQVDTPILLHEVSVQKDQQYALIMGNEVDGVADEVIALADGVIEIPQFGTKHSFNVSVTMGIVAWEFVKKIRLV